MNKYKVNKLLNIIENVNVAIQFILTVMLITLIISGFIMFTTQKKLESFYISFVCTIICIICFAISMLLQQYLIVLYYKKHEHEKRSDKNE